MRVSPGLRGRVELEAVARGVSVSELVRVALERELAPKGWQPGWVSSPGVEVSWPVRVTGGVVSS